MRVLQLLALLFLRYVTCSQNLEVETSLGKILGSTLTTRLGKRIYAFRGIRYAKPPINELRFQPPVPVDKWSGVYNATVDGPVCPQPTDDPVSEDCLLLNVYSTKLPQRGKRNPKRPVIIYLHSGGFFSATGRSNWLGPQYFMDQDIVLVTLNYRLATLGFISVGKEAPGNNGLRDQVVAMKWVKNNIEAFGGDPDWVTLFGYSAGAWSISLHLVSPMSRGLFHKAILGSGSALGYLPKQQIDLAKKQAQLVGCPDGSPKEIINCLKTVPAETLGNSLPQFAEFGDYLLLVWSPVIEEDFGQERFLADHPIKLIESGKFEKIPVVAGVTKDEFANVAVIVVENATLLEMLSNDFERYAPIGLGNEKDANRSREVSRRIRQFYLGGEQPLSNASLPGLAKLYADGVGYAVNTAVEVISKNSPKPVYYYEFTYQGRYSNFYLSGSNGTVPYGVVHHDDLMYLFYISWQFPFFNSSFPESEMVAKLTSLWANFAKTGNPISDSKGEFNGVEWIPYNTHTKKYMEIGNTSLVLKENLFGERYALWRKLFPISLYL